MANSKAKGSSFERKICEDLSLWWTGNKDSSIFWRTAGSGARSTNRAKKGKDTSNQAGDICAIDPIGQPFIDLISLELKKGYNDSSIMDIFDRSEKAAKQTYEKWIEQAQDSAKQAKSPHWMIIHKRDRRRTLVVIPTSLVSFIQKNTNLILAHLQNITCYIRNACIWVFRYEDFFNKLLPNHIKELHKIYKEGK